MDRTSGLALDRAVKHGNFAVIQMLLEHGADPRYSRPLHELIRLRRDRRATAPDAEDDWRLVMEILLRHGAEINAVTYGAGTPLVSAVANNMWDIVEFLLERGADPRRTQPSTGLDAFAVAAKGAGSPWEEKDDVKEFLDWLSDPNSRSDGGEASRVPNGVLENPLVKIVARVHGKKLGND
ncbi:hypothetical protein K458DRAFT_421852 [Lentithecium fluviatile CBS 122367]|uniref:Uncharacterized protein n=1 Tax=Lentithecium fluviatile CBS 122367 TaxID=1168545 RepID=A0A6G1IPX4_9PLEO|nr:hypothetical protein K458DRAFT_421852 [Lentithecium fluviatile CBS 122367]